MYLFDTDHLSLVYRDSIEAVSIGLRVSSLANETVSVSIVSYEEQMRGWLAYSAQAKSIFQQIEAYKRLRSLVEQFRAIPLVDYDERCAAEFARLRKAGVRIGTMDLKIAATALAHDAVLLTRNRRDFEKVPGLRFEDWTE